MQSDLLEGLNTRVVVPVIPLEVAPRPAAVLNPVFDIDGQAHVLVTQFLAAVPGSLLRHPAGSLASQSDQVTRALALLHKSGEGFISGIQRGS